VRVTSVGRNNLDILGGRGAAARLDFELQQNKEQSPSNSASRTKGTRFNRRQLAAEGSTRILPKAVFWHEQQQRKHRLIIGGSLVTGDISVTNPNANVGRFGRKCWRLDQ